MDDALLDSLSSQLSPDTSSNRFNFTAQSVTDCVYKFRFTKQQIFGLRLPGKIITTHRYKAEPLEAICIMLNRVAWPHRLDSMVDG
ncbi:hypothetical protein ACHHYP_20266 [Achlya hypogyna]|uniref:Uncharacterized protein n=1 Tax=Achlya hypogyna TaxID=1202772 RepID=A0A1V9YU22_ACHHY|nr:hypothetical protein ACHHYP_20266 [Achlya hypogyna]